jgi:hypothetical protein
LRQTRYIGLAKTHLQHVLITIALHLIQLDAWFNDVPLAPTRISRFIKRGLPPHPLGVAKYFVNSVFASITPTPSATEAQHSLRFP